MVSSFHASSHLANVVMYECGYSAAGHAPRPALGRDPEEPAVQHAGHLQTEGGERDGGLHPAQRILLPHSPHQRQPQVRSGDCDCLAQAQVPSPNQLS